MRQETRSLRRNVIEAPLLSRWARLAYVLVSLLIAAFAWAATESYEYDGAGRLVRWVDASGEVTDYVYDAVGNILQVRGAAALAPPVINSTTPSVIRSNQQNAIHLAGTGFVGASVHSADPELVVSNVMVSPTTIDFNVEVPPAALLGPRAFSVTNAGGSATTMLQVGPALVIAILPAPIALLPDGIDHKFALVANDSTPFDRVISLASANPAVLRVGATTLTLPAGVMQVDLKLAGLTAGSTHLLVGIPGVVSPILVSAFVGTDSYAANVARSAMVGLAKGGPTLPPGGTHLQTSATAVGLAKGDPTAPPSGQQVGPVVATPVGLNRF